MGKRRHLYDFLPGPMTHKERDLPLLWQKALGGFDQICDRRYYISAAELKPGTLYGVCHLKSPA